MVITDVEMPGMNGIELTREIKLLYPSIHVLAFTSANDDTTSQKLREAGASGFILKGTRDGLTYALDVANGIGPDRRRADRPRAIQSIWGDPTLAAFSVDNTASRHK